MCHAGRCQGCDAVPDEDHPALEAALGSVEALSRALAEDVPVSVAAARRTATVVRHAAGGHAGPSADRHRARWSAGRCSTLLPADMHGMVVDHYAAVLRGEVAALRARLRPDYRATLVPVIAADGTIAGALALALGRGRGAARRARRAPRARAPPRPAGRRRPAGRARAGRARRSRSSTDAACRAVADGLEVELVHVVEHLRRGHDARVRAGVGWSEAASSAPSSRCARSRTRRPRRSTPRAGRDRGPAERQPSGARARCAEHGVVSSANVARSARRRRPRRRARRAHPHPAHVQRAGPRLPARRRPRPQRRASRACAPRSASATTRCTTRSPGCPTARCCWSASATRSTRADAEGRRLALFFLDVDHLKVLNDSLGHHAGDELLRAIGPRLRAVLRPDGHDRPLRRRRVRRRCARASGDEAHALRVAERLVRAFARPFEVRGEPRFCSVSVGVVVSDPDGPRGPAELLSDADAALYRAKERGRGRHEVFDAGLRDRIDRAAADRGRPAPRDRGRRPAVGRLPALLRAARPHDRGRRGAAALEPPRARRRSRRRSSSRWPRTAG